MHKDVILVTGVGRRVGYHLAQRLHHDGFQVVGQFRRHTEECDRLKQLGIPLLHGDFASTEQILAFIDEVKLNCDSLRAIVHNASSFEPTSEDLHQAAQQYEQFFNVHMKAPFLINQALHAQLLASDSVLKDIIHITDINAENPSAKFDIYCSTKGGLHNLTLAQAKKFAPAIKVNAIAPGPVLFSELHSDEVIQQTLSETLLGREGGAEPVYQALKSILDNPFMTGASIAVDGGRRLAKR
jgi:dihydromonapterin reductase/dihydrofolate reductase